MARQSTTPLKFNRSIRVDNNVTMTSGRAGKVTPVAYIPLLRGDAASGRIGVDIELAEMPRPLLNGVMANFQAWFVPKTAHPQFAGSDEFMNSYTGEVISTLGDVDRIPPDFFNIVTSTPDLTTVQNSDFFKTLGLHITGFGEINTDLIDAFNLVYNYRLASHSSRLTRREYAAENLLNSVSLPPAFWPSGRYSAVVPDYDRALVLGNMDMDVHSGSVYVEGLGRQVGTSRTLAAGVDVQSVTDEGSELQTYGYAGNPDTLVYRATAGGNPDLRAELEGVTMGMSLADIDKARTTQAFAKLRTAYAGNDVSGFENDDAIVATLMSGLSVPPADLKRVFLLDSKRVSVGFGERFATDAANLDVSVTQGRASAVLSLNVPEVDSGGTIIVTCEVLPERLDERQSDEWIGIITPSGLPDALRDVQRPEPVDMVLARRLDAAHTSPDALYGYEPMNNVWNRDTTRLGGVFFQNDPNAPTTEQRSGLWLANIVDPAFTSDHFICQEDFPHDVFADTEAPAFELVSRHTLTISGLTQIGDVLAEDNQSHSSVLNHDTGDGTYVGSAPSVETN